MCDALGSCLHSNRIGMDSYQHPSVAYGSARNQKVLKMSPVKSPVQTFHSHMGGSSSATLHGPLRPCRTDLPSG